MRLESLGLAGGGLPLQQPAADRALPHDPVGHGVADGVGGGEGRVGRGRAAVLRLLPARSSDCRCCCSWASGRSSRGDVRRCAGLARMLAWPGGIALGVGIVLIALGAGSSIPGLIAYTFSAFVLATIGQEFWRGTVARRALSGDSVPRAFGQLVARNRRTVRRLHRPRGDRAARDRHRRLECLRLGGRQPAARGGRIDDGRRVHALTAALDGRARGRERDRDSRGPRCEAREQGARDASRRERTRTRSSSRSRTRSGSAPICSRERICSSSPGSSTTTARSSFACSSSRSST